MQIGKENGNADSFGEFLQSMQVGFAKAVEEMEVAEVYSVPRVTTAAAKMGLKAGWALDLGTTDEQGRPWDFTKVEARNRATRRVIEDRPLVLIGSPPCTDWSTLMNLNWDRMDPERVAERKRLARIHLEFCAKLYKIQHDAGRYFLHEHPHSAASWHEEVIKQLCQLEGILTVSADQCRYGLKAD